MDKSALLKKSYLQIFDGIAAFATVRLFLSFSAEKDYPQGVGLRTVNFGIIQMKRGYNAAVIENRPRRWKLIIFVIGFFFQKGENINEKETRRRPFSLFFNELAF